MRTLAMPVYQLLAILPPVLIAFFVFHRRRKRCGFIDPFAHFLLLLVFVFYIAGVFYFTGPGTVFDLARRGIDIQFARLNFIPFSRSTGPMFYFLNILLFLPLGFLLPLIRPKTGRLPRVLAAGFAFSLFVELSQMLSIRATDVDDLIMNTAGAALGYAVFRAFAHAVKWNNPRTEYCGCEPAVYIAAAFLGRFLLFNQFGAASFFNGF